jgi:hypothetical protein
MQYFQCLLKYMIICAFENSPSIPSFFVTKIVYIGYSFSFYLPWNSIEKGCHTNCVTFLAFLTTHFDEHFFLERDISMIFCAYASVRQYAIIICRCPQNIIEISLSRKKCSSKCVVKNARNVTQFVWQGNIMRIVFFYWKLSIFTFGFF